MTRQQCVSLLINAVFLFSFVSVVLADQSEYDRCSCKLALKGAESTLKGGVCIRTEASTCLMEWGGGSVAPTVVGSGLNQREAGMRADTDFSKLGDAFRIPRLVDSSLPESPTKLDIAIQNLARIPPSDYRKPGIPESFLLAAGSALIRFAKTPLTFVAESLLLKRREEFVNVLSKGGEMKVEQYLIKATTPGCLIVEDPNQRLLVFIKTPFAMSERC
jgi:hypothetical protein